MVEADELQARVRELGAEISRDYAGRDLLLLGVLKGAVFFLADLMRAVEAPCELDFMAVSSYGSLTDSTPITSATGFRAWATFDRLTAGTRYHWRAKFVSDDGHRFSAPDLRSDCRMMARAHYVREGEQRRQQCVAIFR